MQGVGCRVKGPRCRVYRSVRLRGDAEGLSVRRVQRERGQVLAQLLDPRVEG